MRVVSDTSFMPIPRKSKGKVRDIYDLGDRLILLVTDRISAFDVVFPDPIPEKGAVLNSMSAFWFDKLEDICPNHVISIDVADFPAELQPFAKYLEGRTMLVKKAEMLPAECIVRGYLEGSALKEYRSTGKIAGIKMPEGLRQGDKLPEPIFTPSTKAEEGHDINISYDELVDMLGADVAAELRDKSLALYKAAADFALEKGIIIADTKFEFGYIDGVLCICDELFTPDSSRFWDLATYEPGKAQISFDKQYLREYLETLEWDKTPPAPELPAYIMAQTAAKYKEAYERLTGHKLK